MPPADRRSPGRAPLVVDAHNDAIVSLIRRGNRSLGGGDAAHLAGLGGIVELLRGPLPAEQYEWHGQADLDRLQAGGVSAAFFAVDVTAAWKNHLAYALDAFGYFLADLGAVGDRVVLARGPEEIRAAHEAGRLAAVLVIENSDALEGSLNVLRAFFTLGVRSVVLTHNPSSWAAAGNAENASGGGLTRFGVALVEAMDRLGMLVDVSHIARRGFFDVLSTTRRPVIASHSCCAALCDHPRNLDDDQLRALAENGGVVGITFVGMFLEAGWNYDRPPPPVERVIEHIDHAVEVAGVDHVGIGSDFDGGGVALRHAGEFPLLVEALGARGYGDDAVRKIMGENILRILAPDAG